MIIHHEKLQPLVGEISWAKHLVIIGKCKDPRTWHLCKGALHKHMAL